MFKKHNMVYVSYVSVTALITSVQRVPEGPDIRVMIRAIKVFFFFFCLNNKIQKFMSFTEHILIK